MTSRRAALALVAVVTSASCAADPVDETVRAATTIPVVSVTESTVGAIVTTPRPPVPSSPGSTEPVEEPAYLGPLTFDWPGDCSVPVSAGAVKWNDDGTIRGGALFRFRLVLTSSADGLLVESTEFELDEPAGTPAEQWAQLAVELLPPTFVVGDTGAVVEIRGLDPIIEQFAGGAGIDAGEVDATFFDAYYRTFVWGAWVGLWSAIGQIEPTPESTDSLTSSTLGVGDLDSSIWALPDTRHGVVFASTRIREPGAAQLFARWEPAATDFASALDALVPGLGTNIGSVPLDDVGGVAVNISASVEPTTLRPRSVLVARELSEEDGTIIGYPREDHWEFDWAASDCTEAV